jgi:hypothetical protein
VLPGQRAALLAAGLPAPPEAGAPEERQEQRRQQQAEADGGCGGDGGGALPVAPRWLPGILQAWAGGAALAAAFDPGASDAAKRGAAFAARWAEEAAAIQAALAEADGAWGPLLLGPCVAEGWRGEYSLPGGGAA